MRINYLSLILSLTLLFSNQAAFSQESTDKSPQIEYKKCAAFVAGLDFCLKSTIIYANFEEHVMLHFLMKNNTEKPITIAGWLRNGYDVFDLTVTDKNGNRLATILETLAKKQQSVGLSKEESNRFFGFIIYSGPVFGNFKSKEERKEIWDLSNFYDFKNKGRYFVEIAKKPSNQNENANTKTLLGKVEIEIK